MILQAKHEQIKGASDELFEYFTVVQQEFMN